jgi:hypothetical protein
MYITVKKMRDEGAKEKGDGKFSQSHTVDCTARSMLMTDFSD